MGLLATILKGGLVDAPELWIELPEAYGAALFDRLAKGAGHRYIRRQPTGNPKRPWRYFYAVASKSHDVGHEQHFVVGAAFKHEGGHWHIKAVDGDRLTIEHDETRETRHVTKAELSKMLREHHAAALAAHRERAALPASVRRLAPGPAREMKLRELAVEAAQKLAAGKPATDAAKAAELKTWIDRAEKLVAKHRAEGHVLQAKWLEGQIAAKRAELAKLGTVATSAPATEPPKVPVVEPKATEAPTPAPVPPPKPAEPKPESAESAARREHQEVGTHVWGSRADLAQAQIETVADLDTYTDAQAAKLVTKARLLPDLDAEAHKAAGGTVGGLLAKQHIRSLIGSKAPDSREGRKLYVEGMDFVARTLDACKTSTDVKEAMQDLQFLAQGYRSTGERHTDFRGPAYGASGIEARSERAGGFYGEGPYRRFQRDPEIPSSMRENPYARKIAALGQTFARAVAGHTTPTSHKAWREAIAADAKPWSEHETAVVEPKTKTARKPFDGLSPHADWRKMVTAISRETLERRGGTRTVANPSGEAMSADFGLKNVQHGNWVNDDERAHHLREAHNALFDLADVLGIDPKTVSLNGRLSIGFGARGKGAANAHYEPLGQIINLTKFGGGATVAHEWGHFLDHVLGESGKPAGSTSGAAAWATSPRDRASLSPDVKTATGDVMDAIQGKLGKPTFYYRSAAAMNGKPKGGDKDGYWTRPTELWARAFESYVEDKLHAANRRSPYLVSATRPKFSTGHMVPPEAAAVNAEPGVVKARADEAGARAVTSAMETESRKRAYAKEGIGEADYGRKSSMAAIQRADQAVRAELSAKPEWKAAREKVIAATKAAMAAVERAQIVLGRPAQMFPRDEERTAINAAFDRLMGVLRAGKHLEKALRRMGRPGIFATLLKSRPAEDGPRPHERELDPAEGARLYAEQEGRGIFARILKAGAGGHKYIRRTGTPGHYHYFYSEASTAHAAKEGERINLKEKGIHEVVKVHDNGKVQLRHTGTGEERTVHVADLHKEIHAVYGSIMDRGAERTVKAVLAKVGKVDATPAGLIRAYRERFAALGVSKDHADALLHFVASRKGWHDDAKRTLAELSATKQNVHRVRTIASGAEALARADKAPEVAAKHVAKAAALPTGPALDDVRSKVATMVGKLEASLGAVEAVGEHAPHRRAMVDYAHTVATSPAMSELETLVTAYPAMATAPEYQRMQALQTKVRELTGGAPANDDGKGLRGAETVVFVADAAGNPTPQTARYRLIEAGEAVASHDPTQGFKKNAAYPEGVQERAYHSDKEHQDVVRTNARRLQPALVINTNPDAVNGPPLMSKDGIVLGGNSRTMALQIAHEEGGAASSAYKKHLTDNAATFGFTAADVAKMKRPMLVREVDTEGADKKALGVLVRRYNESYTQGMDPRVDQVARARLVTPGMLDTLGQAMSERSSSGDDRYATLSAYLDSPRSKELIADMSTAGIIDRRNRAVYLRDNGSLNEDGKTFVERLLVGKVLPDPDLLGEMKPSQVSAIARSTPQIVRAASHGHDLAPHLADALQASVYMDRNGLKTTDELDRDQGLGDFAARGAEGGDKGGWDEKPKLAPEAKALLDILRDKPGAVQMASAFREIAQHAARNPAGQADLEGKSKTTADILRMVSGGSSGRENQQAGLFRGGILASLLKGMLKGARGTEKPGHKYTSRHPDGKGGWEYTYGGNGEHGAAKRIVKVLRVEDTRQYEEQGDRFVPVPGSGNTRDCDRCGRAHEVHAHVQLDDGTEAVVGSGCMTAHEAEAASRVKSATSAAKTAARLRAELAAHEKRRAAYLATVKEVDALPVPPVEATQKTISDGTTMPVLRMGDAEVWLPSYAPDSPRRRQELLSMWRRNRLVERGFRSSVQRDQDLERRVERAEAKTTDLLKGVLYMGPRGGRYGNAAHTTPYRESTDHAIGETPEKKAERAAKVKKATATAVAAHDAWQKAVTSCKGGPESDHTCRKAWQGLYDALDHLGRAMHLDVHDGEDWAEAAATRLRSQGHRVSLKFASGHGPPPEEAKRQIDMFKARRPFWRQAGARPFWEGASWAS